MQAKHSLGDRGVIAGKLVVAGIIGALIYFALMSIHATRTWIHRTGWWNPLIECTNPQLDLGEIEPGTQHSCLFFVANRGHRQLRISRVRVGCASCLKVINPPPSILLPQQEATVVVEFFSNGLKGPLIRTLSIQSNDPVHPSLVLTIRATVSDIDSPAMIPPYSD